MQETTELLNTVSTQLGLNINTEQQPHYIERRPIGRDGLVHIPGQYNKQKLRHIRHQSKDTESKSCIHHVEKRLESKTNQNSNRTENIQFKCQGSFTLWIGDMAKVSTSTLWKMTNQLPIEN